jgi:hypothetical protein
MNELDEKVVNGYFYPLNKRNKIMPIPENLPYPIEPAPPDWRSAHMLSDQFVGNSAKINQDILALKEKLKQEGKTPDDIASKWIRFCVSPNGAMRAWYISPQGEERLRQEKLLLTPAEFDALKAPPGWHSAKMLSDQFVGGHAKINQDILALKEKLKQEGKTPEDIANTWIRFCVPLNGKRAWYISPEGEERLIKDYKLQRKSPRENQDRAICSLLAAGMDAPAIGIALKIGKTGTEKRIAAIRTAIENGTSVELAEYKAEIAHNRSIDRATFLAAIRECDSIEVAAELLGLSPKRVMARLGRYMSFDQSLFNTLDSPGVNFDLAASTDFTHLPKTSIYATWHVVRDYHQTHHAAPNLNQLAKVLGIKRTVVDKNVTFLIAADMLRREQLAQDDSASSAGASPTTAMAIKFYHGIERC